MAACLLMATLGVCAQTHEKDSLRVIKPAGSRNYLDPCPKLNLWNLPMSGKEQLRTEISGKIFPSVVIYSISTDNELAVPSVFQYTPTRQIPGFQSNPDW